MSSFLRLMKMTHGQVKKAVAKGAIAMLPVGSTEQHGHIPIGTDAFIAEKIAESVAENLANFRPTVLCPLLPYGMSEHHTAFPGTLSLPRGLYVQVLETLLHHLWRSGFPRLVIINGHGGNDSLIFEAIGHITSYTPGFQIRNVTIKSMRAPDDFRRKYPGEKPGPSNKAMGKLCQVIGEHEMSHADAAEASILFALLPFLYGDTVMAELGQRDDSPRLPDLSSISGVRDPQDWKKKTKACAGGKGDPRYCDAKVGKIVFRKIVAAIVKDAKIAFQLE